LANLGWKRLCDLPKVMITTPLNPGMGGGQDQKAKTKKGKESGQRKGNGS